MTSVAQCGAIVEIRGTALLIYEKKLCYHVVAREALDDIGEFDFV